MARGQQEREPPYPSAVESGLAHAGGVADALAVARKRMAALQDQVVRLSRFTVVERMTLELSHELRQPLAAIANYLHAAQRLATDSTAHSHDRLAMAIDGAVRQSHHAGQLVARLRSFVAQGEAERRVEPLAVLVEEAVALARPDTDASGVRVSLELDPSARQVLVDRVQIQQVLLNLIHNAVLAMRDWPRRDLVIATRSADDRVAITVTDSGRGVPEELADRLFEPFVTTRPDGTGLGLMICRSIVEAHGGVLSCESLARGGSSFSFTVAGVVDGATSLAIDEGVVHVIDDDDGVRDSLLFLLEVEGVKARGFASAEAFLAYLTDQTSGCVVTDLRMPGLGGLDLQRALAERSPFMPVILMTGYGNGPTKMRALADGAFDFIEKPFQDTAILGAIRAALTSGEPHPDHAARLIAMRRCIAQFSDRDHATLEALLGNDASPPGVSAGEIDALRARITSRVGACSFVDLVRLAIEARRLPDPTHVAPRRHGDHQVAASL